MNRVLTNQEGELLVLLAKRQNPTLTYWASHRDVLGGLLPPFRMVCLICYDICEGSSLNEHGLNHLKEKGLLAFI